LVVSIPFCVLGAVSPGPRGDRLAPAVIAIVAVVALGFIAFVAARPDRS
jgi:hypothetical protein